MTKWEHMQVTFWLQSQTMKWVWSSKGERIDIQQIGEAGWECAGVIFHSRAELGFAIFKRKKPEK